MPCHILLIIAQAESDVHRLCNYLDLSAASNMWQVHLVRKQVKTCALFKTFAQFPFHCLLPHYMHSWLGPLQKEMC